MAEIQMNIKVVGFKSVEIQEILDVTYDEIIQAAALSHHALKYCNGHLFAITGFDPSEQMKIDESNGIYKFQTVGVASYGGTYEPVIKHKASNTEIPVMDFSQSKFYNDLTEFITGYLKVMKKK